MGSSPPTPNSMIAPDPLTPGREAELARVLLDRHFDVEWFRKSDSLQQENYLRDHVRGRYDICRTWLIPWLQRFVDLRDTDVVEIGCGTGSTSAALALEARSVNGYDIVAKTVDVARARAAIMGLENVRFHHHPSTILPAEIAAAHPQSTVHVVVCFAVLEHAKYQERLELLRLMWGMLAPGGLLVIGDTPNRLSYWDGHTSWLPFFDSLPNDIAIDYLQRSPRRGHVESIARARQQSPEIAEEWLARAGRGASYHEFELALGDIAPLIVGDGFDPEPLSYYGVSLETRVLYSYASLKGLGVHPAFLRSTIEVILRKPGGREDVGLPAPRDLDRIVRPFGGAERWRLAASEGNRATLLLSADSSDEMRVAFGTLSGTERWRVQLVCRPMALHMKAECQISFRARAEKPRTIGIAVKESQAPWAGLGLHVESALSTEWQTITHAFRPRADCASAVVSFELGGSDVAVEFADVEIRHLLQQGSAC